MQPPQYLPVEFILESSAIFAGILFAVVALFGVMHYSSDIQYRRWAKSQLLLWLAFLPINIFQGLPYIGNIIGCFFRFYGCILLLRAFNFPRLSKVPNSVLYTTLLIVLIGFYVPVFLLALPTISGSVPASLLMVMTFYYVSKRILSNRKNRTKIWRSAGAAYLLWSIASIPMILLPFIPWVISFGYIQFIAQAMVMITMFLSFIGLIMQQTKEYLKLTTIYSQLITHDMRNYLLVARAALDLVVGKDDESDKLIETTQSSLSSAADFMTKTRDIWLGLGETKRYIDDLDLNLIIDDVVSRTLSEHSIDKSSITINSSPECFVCSTPLIAQVLWNLVDNSIKHSCRTPEILITIEMAKDVRLSVTDMSGGMSETVKRRLLSKNEEVNGLGIGLALVKQITSIFGIPLFVQDNIKNNETVGTIVTLEIPHSGGRPSTNR